MVPVLQDRLGRGRCGLDGWPGLYRKRGCGPGSRGWFGRTSLLCLSKGCALLIHVAYPEGLGKLFGRIFAEIELDGRVGVEVVERCMAPELDPAVLEVVSEWFSLLDQDETLTILDDNPDYPDEPDGMGEDPLGG
jgi:hypothetical protein